MERRWQTGEASRVEAVADVALSAVFTLSACFTLSTPFILSTPLTLSPSLPLFAPLSAPFVRFVENRSALFA